MKKNLAKRIVLGLLTGAVIMGSSVAWAADDQPVGHQSIGITSVISGNEYIPGFSKASSDGEYSIYIGVGSWAQGDNAIAIGSGETSTTASGTDSIAIGRDAWVKVEDSTRDIGSIAIGASAEANGKHNVALGSGSIAVSETDRYVVSVGAGGGRNGGVTDIGNYNWVPSTRSIINVTDIVRAVDGVNTKKKFSDLTDEQKEEYGSYVVNLNTLSDALSGYYTKADVDNTFVKIKANDAAASKQPEISVDANGQMVFGSTSSWIDGTGKGFYAGTIDDAKGHVDGNEKAAIKDTGEIIGASGQFKVDTSGNVTATNLYTKDDLYNKDEVDTALDLKANQKALEDEVDARIAADKDLQSQIDNIGGGAISGINQRLDKTNAKINKVGAGAAALAALHPLEYDPDDKLTFSAGMGNYAGENAAALGAFYRPNEKFMVSLGGTMGNGENMVNLGLSIGLDKPNGYAKLSKRELIQEVNAVKLENQAMKDQLANADERIAKLEALVAQLVKK